MKKKIFCTRKKFIDQIKSWCYHAINNFFSWSRKILLLTFLYIKPYLIYYAKILATGFFLIKKKAIYDKHFFIILLISVEFLRTIIYYIMINHILLFVAFHYIFSIPVLYHIFGSFYKVFCRTNLLHTSTTSS